MAEPKQPISLVDSKGGINISIAIAYSDLILGKELGEGSFGIVYKGEYRYSDVAVKKLKIATLNSAAIEEFKREASLMAKLSSPCIVRLYGACFEPPNYALVMEYMPKGSLYDVLHSGAALSWKIRYQIGVDTGVGLAYLHEENIIHADLKSLNVLVDDNYRAKIADFGLSKVKLASNVSTSFGPAKGGTILWMAPELLTDLSAKTTKASDMYSYGMILWELGTCKRPFEGKNPFQVGALVANGARETIPLDTPPIMAQLIGRCWEQWNQRPKIAEAVKELKQEFSTYRFEKPDINIINPQISNLLQQPLNFGVQRNFFQAEPITVSILKGHTRDINCLVLLHDGKLVSGSDDGTIKVWDVDQGQCIKTLQGDTGSINCLILLHDGRLVSGSHAVEIWDINTGQCLKTLECHTEEKRPYYYPPRINCLVSLPDGRVVSGSSDGTIKTWDINSGQYLKILEEQYYFAERCSINCMILLSDGRLVSGGQGSIKIWNINTGRCLKAFEDYSYGVNCFALLSENRLISGSHAVKIWDINTGQCLKTLECHTEEKRYHPPSINCLLSLPDGRLANSRDDWLMFLKRDTIEIWNQKELQYQVNTNHTASVSCLSLLFEGKLASGSLDRTIKVWDINSGKCLKTLKGHIYSIFSLTFLPNGKLVSAAQDSTIKIWDINTGQCIKTLEDHTGNISCLISLFDGRLLSGSWDKTIKIWDPNSGQCLRTLGGHSDPINCLTLLPDDRLASGSRDSTIKIWDINTGQCLKTLKGFATDSWHTTVFKGHTRHTAVVWSLISLPDGRLVSGSYKDIKIWDVNSEQCLMVLEGHTDHVRVLTLLPNGKLVSGSMDKTIKIWDVSSGKCLKTLEGSVSCLLVLPDGRLVSDAADYAPKIWSHDEAQCQIDNYMQKTP